MASDGEIRSGLLLGELVPAGGAVKAFAHGECFKDSVDQGSKESPARNSCSALTTMIGAVTGTLRSVCIAQGSLDR